VNQEDADPSLRSGVSCSNCEGELTADSDFCPHCGYLLTDAALFCEVHETVEASGVCIVCQRLVCEMCSEESERRVLCLDHLDVHVEGDWAEVFRSTDVNDAELAKSLLLDAGHHVEVQGFGSIGYAWDGGGDNPMSRSNLNNPAKIFVPLDEYLKAKEMLDDWGNASIDSTSAT
jgi:hypothetical protein